jgi:uncharacterized protein (TIGR02246 family)
MVRILLTIMFAVSSCAVIRAEETDRLAVEEAAIRQAVEAYVVAFNQGDAKSLAELWTPNAVYTNHFTGEEVTGRAAIQEQFAQVFAGVKGLKLEATTHSIQFVSPNVAVEHGTARLLHPEEAPEESRYTAVFVKRDDTWLLDRVREDDVPFVPTAYEHLKDLEWMIGTWIDQDEDARIETACEWTKNQTFITRSFAIAVRDRLEVAGMQFVGWDPAAKQIRSWVFDSDGGFGEGVWKKHGRRLAHPRDGHVA